MKWDGSNLGIILGTVLNACIIISTALNAYLMLSTTINGCQGQVLGFDPFQLLPLSLPIEKGVE